MSRPTLLLAALAAVVLTGLRAQMPAGQVLLYAEPNFRGEALAVPAGTALDNLAYVQDSRGRSWNDRIVSVRVEGPVVLVAFEHAYFRGAQATFTRPAGDLAAFSLGSRGGDDWARRISSVQVAPIHPAAPVFLRWERRDAERAVRSAYRDILGRDPDRDGLRNYVDRLIAAGWTEDRLRDELRRSPEFRSRDVEAIVRRIYREVLGRDPDPSGVATYTRRLQGGMTEAELRADLRRSGERAQNEARSAITRAYRDILRRDPDAAGLAHYLQQMLERGWDEGRVREALRQSDEYRKLPHR